MTANSGEPDAHWPECLALARRLLTEPSSGSRAADEARYRTAVSRSYYAAYNTARAVVGPYVTGCGLGCHEELLRRVGELTNGRPTLRDATFTARGRDYGGKDFCAFTQERLRRAKQLRVHADYQGATFDARKAQEAIEAADRAIESCGQLRPYVT